MMETKAAAYGIYPRDISLPEVACTLNQAGYENEDICMVVSPAHPMAKIVRDANMLEGDSIALSTRIIGWISALGAVVIPSVGLFIRSRVFFHALMVEQDFALFCGKSRTLSGLGFSDDDAERLDHQIGDHAGVLVYVTCPRGARADRAIELLRSTGASEAAALRQAHAVAMT